MVGIAEHFKRVVVLQPCLELVKQNHAKLDGAGMNTTMVDSLHGKKNLDADFVYTTPQTLAKNLDNIAEPDLLIIDECNCFYNGTLFNTIFKHWKKCKVVGFTATPYHYERKTIYKSGWMWSETTCHSIEEQYGPAVINISRDDGYSMGYSPKITMTKIRITPIRSEHLDNPVYKALVDRHLDEVAVLMDKINNAIIYCDSRSHAELLAKTFGCPTVFGSTPKKQREQIVEQFTSGQIPFVFTVGCLTRGFDYQGLENIIILTPFHNPCEAEQVIGRLARGTCNKTCWYNQQLNTSKPVPGKVELVKVKKL